MKAFAGLFVQLDSTTKTNEKVEALVRYFQQVSAAEAAWTVYFLCGRKPRSIVSTKLLKQWVLEFVGLSEWLFDECYDAVGDMAETITLLVPPGRTYQDLPLNDWIEQRLLPLQNKEDSEKRAAIQNSWQMLDTPQLFVWTKLLTGGFRVGVSQQLVIRSLAKYSGLKSEVIAHRLMGEWSPTPEFFTQLLAMDTADADSSRPYPFCLAHPLEEDPSTLGDVADWQAEWKWDGIRCQLIRRNKQTFLWTRGEELVTDRYPELRQLGDTLPEGTVIDGEILPWKDSQPLPFAELQRRIGRKTIGKKLLEEIPVILMAYDRLERSGMDLREQPLEQRRAGLEELIDPEHRPRLLASPLVHASCWEDLARQRSESRSQQVEGLMLKRKTSVYRVGRVRGDWWKWKVQPFLIDAVLIYAQGGHGKRASLFTDYTFGVWDGDKLVPIAKAYSGLTDNEIKLVDAFIRQNTLEKFGPVRTVKPELVFELAFEGIQQSTRHKSGIAVRFPRMNRWRTDKKPTDADTLEQIKTLLKQPRQ